MSIRRHLKQTVELKRVIARDPIYGDATYETSTVPARKIEKTRLVRSSSGSEVVSDTEVWLELEPTTDGDIDGRPIQGRESMVNLSGRIEGWRAFL